MVHFPPPLPALSPSTKLSKRTASWRPAARSERLWSRSELPNGVQYDVNPASSLVPNCSWMAGEPRFNRRAGGCLGGIRSDGLSDSIDVQRERNAMNGRASSKKEFSKRGEKPTTYRRVVTENSKGKAVVQSNCTRTVHERVVFSLLGLAFERKQIPRFVGNVSS